MRILLVEDNKALCEATALALRNEGWSVDTVHRGDEARFYLAEGGYDAILLDRMLPGCDGIQLVREMRQQKDDTPVLLVTALDDVRARVDGLDAGADDYLSKPFDTCELCARVRALGRRRGALAQELRFADLVYYPAGLMLHGALGKCTLARKEGELLEALLRQNGQPISRRALFARLWGADADVEDACLDSYAYYIRRRLKAVTQRVRLVTVRGVGYRLEDAGESQ